MFQNLLKVALEYDEKYYHEYVAILVHYLQDPEFQEKICTPETLDDLIVLMLDFEARLPPEEVEAVFHELAITKTSDTPPSEETTVLLLSQLINSISGTSATNAFADRTAFNLTTSVIERTRALLTPPTKPSKPQDFNSYPSLVSACVMLGNLATSDEICIAMVSNWRIHVSLKEVLLHSTHSALLFAALGFLRHLAFPEQNRGTLGKDGVLEACQHLLTSQPTDAAVRGEVAALLGKLVTNNLDNITRVVNGTEPTCLQTLVHQSLQPATPLPSTSMKNFSIETGRTIVSILRFLGRSNTPNLNSLHGTIFSTPHIARPIARLVRQRFYLDARSEGLLGLGLMAQTTAGAKCVIAEMEEDEGLLEAIKEFAEGKDGGAEQGGQAGGRDYQNAMVLLQALQNTEGEGDGGLMERIAGLQEGLGRMMI